MKINEQILNYLTNKLNKDEIKLFEDKLNSDLNFKKEFDELKNKFDRTIFSESRITSNDYKNEVIVNVQNRINTQKKSKLLVKISYSFSFAAIIILLGILFYPNKEMKLNKPLITFTQAEKEIINSIKNDQETINKIYQYDFLSVSTPSKKAEISYSKYDEDIKEIAQYDKNYLARNDIPIIDDAVLYDYLDNETIEKVFSKIEKL